MIIVFDLVLERLSRMFVLLFCFRKTLRKLPPDHHFYALCSHQQIEAPGRHYARKILKQSIISAVRPVRHENGAFRKRSSNRPEEIKKRSLGVLGVEPFENEKVTIMVRFS